MGGSFFFWNFTQKSRGWALFWGGLTFGGGGSFKVFLWGWVQLTNRKAMGRWGPRQDLRPVFRPGPSPQRQWRANPPQRPGRQPVQGGAHLSPWGPGLAAPAAKVALPGFRRRAACRKALGVGGTAELAAALRRPTAEALLRARHGPSAGQPTRRLLSAQSTSATPRLCRLPLAFCKKHHASQVCKELR